MTPLPLDSVRLLAPVLPSKVVAVGRNYAEHAKEMGGNADPTTEPPIVFLKPSTSVIGPGDAVQYPVGVSEEVSYEGELAVVIAPAVPRGAAGAGRGTSCSASPAPTT